MVLRTVSWKGGTWEAEGGFETIGGRVGQIFFPPIGSFGSPEPVRRGTARRRPRSSSTRRGSPSAPLPSSSLHGPSPPLPPPPDRLPPARPVEDPPPPPSFPLRFTSRGRTSASRPPSTSGRMGGATDRAQSTSQNRLATPRPSCTCVQAIHARHATRETQHTWTHPEAADRCRPPWRPHAWP